MKHFPVLLGAAVILLFGACSKSNDDISQTKSRLQFKWTLISERLNYPDNPGINQSYLGKGSDYYDFRTNDSLLIDMKGTAGLPTTPWYSLYKYTVKSGPSFTLDIAPTLPIRINVLTDNLLVFSNDITYTIQENGGSKVYYGTRVDSLRR